MKALLIAFLLPFTVAAQSDSLTDNRLCFKISPLSLIVPYVGSCAKLSAEYKIRNNISFQHEAGVFFYSSKGFETKFEVKYYTDRRDKVTGNYFSAELFHKYQSYTTANIVDTADPYEQNYILLPPFDVSKNVECLTIKYGNLSVYRFGFIVDAFCGLGIRFQQNRNSLSPEENAKMPPTSDYGPNLILDKAGNRVYPNFVLGVKIGFRVLK